MAGASVVGVDFGTLSGRAVVVRVDDGAELGSAVHEYAHGVIERELPATGERLPPRLGAAGPRGLHRGAARGGARGRSPRPASRRRTSSGSPPTSPPRPRCRCCADGTPLCRVDGFERPPARLPEAVEAPRRAGAGRPHQRRRRRARRAVAGALRRADLLRVGVRQGAAGARGGPRGLRRAWTAGSRAPTGSSGSSAASETRNACTAGYKGIRQDGATRRPTSWRRSTSASPGFVADKLEGPPLAALGARAGALTRARPRGPGCPRASPSRSATSTRTSPRRPRRRSSPGQMLMVMGTSTCHVMNAESLAEVPGMCGVVRRRDRARAVGLRGRPERRRRHLRLVRRQRRPAALPRRGAERGIDVHEYLSELAGEQEVGEHGLVALDWHSGNRSVLVDHELSGLIVGLHAGRRGPRTSTARWSRRRRSARA